MYRTFALGRCPSAKRSGVPISGAGDRKRVERVKAVRKQLKEALRELDQIDFELQGGCNW
jgi:hypothetical protein